MTDEYLHFTMSGGDENVFDCAICTEAFSDPRILRCFHTFCRNCLQQLADKSSHKKSFDCPLCRETYVLPANGVDGIQKNFYLSSTPAPKKARLPFCKEHTEEDLRFYCYKCKRAICRDCKVLSQLGHQIDLISNVAAEYRIKLDDLINQTDVCVEYFENYHNDISKRSTVAIGLISQMASTCKREIDILQDRLTSEVKLDSNHKGFRQILKDIKDKIHRLRHKKESLLAYKDTRKVDDFIKAYDDLVEEKTISLDNSSYKAACLDDEKEAFAEKEALLMFENVSQAIQSEVKSCNVKRLSSVYSTKTRSARLRWYFNTHILSIVQSLLCFLLYAQVILVLVWWQAPGLENAETLRALPWFDTVLLHLYIPVGLLLTAGYHREKLSFTFTILNLALFWRLVDTEHTKLHSNLILIGVYLGYIGAYLQFGKDRRFRWCGNLCMFAHVLLQTVMVVIRNFSVDFTAVIFCAAFLFVCLRTYALSAKLFRESCIILLVCLEYSNSFTFTVWREVRLRDFMRKEHTFVAMTEQTDGEINIHLLFVSISIIVWLIYNHLTNQIEEKTSYNQNYSGSCKPRAYRVFLGLYFIVLIGVVTKYFENKYKNS